MTVDVFIDELDQGKKLFGQGERLHALAPKGPYVYQTYIGLDHDGLGVWDHEVVDSVDLEQLIQLGVKSWRIAYGSYPSEQA
jgi:hypothetical protein